MKKDEEIRLYEMLLDYVITTGRELKELTHDDEDIALLLGYLENRYKYANHKGHFYVDIKLYSFLFPLFDKYFEGVNTLYVAGCIENSSTFSVTVYDDTKIEKSIIIDITEKEDESKSMKLRNALCKIIKSTPEELCKVSNNMHNMLSGYESGNYAAIYKGLGIMSDTDIKQVYDETCKKIGIDNIEARVSRLANNDSDWYDLDMKMSDFLKKSVYITSMQYCGNFARLYVVVSDISCLTIRIDFKLALEDQSISRINVVSENSEVSKFRNLYELAENISDYDSECTELY